MKRQLLTWEWSAGRSPARQVRVRLTDIRSARGLLGLPISPSLPNGFVDPVRIDGQFVGGEGAPEKGFRLIAPGAEVSQLRAGETWVFDWLDPATVIGVGRPPATPA